MKFTGQFLDSQLPSVDWFDWLSYIPAKLQRFRENPLSIGLILSFKKNPLNIHLPSGLSAFPYTWPSGNQTWRAGEKKNMCSWFSQLGTSIYEGFSSQPRLITSWLVRDHIPWIPMVCSIYFPMIDLIRSPKFQPIMPWGYEMEYHCY